MLERGGAVVKLSKTPNTGTWTADTVAIKTDFSGLNNSAALNIKVDEEIRTYLRFSPTPARTPVEWSASDPSVLEVTGMGPGVLIKGLKAGSTSLIARNPINGVVVTAEVKVNPVPIRVAPWVLNNPLPFKVTYNSSTSATIMTDSGRWDWSGMSTNYVAQARRVRNLHLLEVDTKENMEITAEITFNPPAFAPAIPTAAAVANLAAGIVFYHDDLNMVAAQRRMTSASASRLDVLGNRENASTGRPTSTLITTTSDESASNRALTVEFRLVKAGSVYTGYYRYRGSANWTQIGSTTYTSAVIGGQPKIKVGFYAYTGRTGWDIFYNVNHWPATFENFKLDGVLQPFAGTSASIEKSADGTKAVGIFAIGNSTNDAFKAQCIIASYDSAGKLKEINNEIVDVQPGGGTFTVGIPHGAEMVKAFIWDEIFVPIIPDVERAVWD